MQVVKFLLSLVVTVVLVWALGRSYQVGEAAHVEISEAGDTTYLPSTERMIPPLGKLLSPSHGFWQNAEGATPNLATSLDHSYLSAPVQIQYDDRMVPHIFASNTKDALFAQGYATASLRLWQMEFQTHSAAGRLAEILGTTERLRGVLVERDRAMRRLGLPWAARRSLEHWAKDPEKYQAINDYAAGVNAYIESLSDHDLPLFYKLQNYRPEAWSTLKTALLLKYMGYMLTNKEHDFEQTAALKELGLQGFQRLYPAYFPQQSPIILDTMDYASTRIDSVNSAPLQFYLGEMGWDSLTRAVSPKGIGSNNWAVAGSKTASGYPILCNDPHLELNLPSIWFEIQISTPDFNVYGASLPGAPAVISGFNEHVAWGITNVSHDVKDWYAIQWKDDSKQEYWFDSTYKKADYWVETITVRDADPIYDTIYETHIGPVAYQHKGQDFALRWTLHDPAEEPLTFLKLLKAKNYNDYKDAIGHFGCPAQNFVFAAKNGDIALWTQGKLPLRQPMQGRFVHQGTNSAQLWQGYIPQNHIPHEYNPEKGFVASANQHSIDPAVYPYDFYGYFEEYRGRYLNRRLQEADSVTIQDMMALQYDAYSVKAEDFMGLLYQHLQKGTLDKNALEVWHNLKDWDLRYTKDQVAPTIFDHWHKQLRVMVYDELEVDNKRHEAKLPDDIGLLVLLQQDTTHPYLDYQATTDYKEQVADIITLSFQEAATTVPRDTSTGEVLAWGANRATLIQHLARIPAFSIANVSSDGDPSSLNALGTRPGPSWRLVVQLGPTIEAYAVYPGGQSGNPGSAFYKTNVATWEVGDYHRLLFMKTPEDYKERMLFTQALEP